MACESVAALLGDGAGDGFRGQIEDFLREPAAHGKDSGVERGNRFADTCGGFDEEFAALGDGFVDSGHQVLLSRPVREREGQRLYGGVSGLLVVLLPFGVAAVFAAEGKKPVGEIFTLEGFGEIADMFGI